MSFIPDHTNLCTDATSIMLFGTKIQEPMAALTDLLITAVCWYVFIRSKKEVEKNNVTTLFRYFFLVMGFSTLLGGICGHAFCYRLGIAFKLPGWIMSMFAIMLCERSAIMHIRKVVRFAVGNFLIVLNIVELIFMISIACITLNFFFVEFHALYGLLFITGSFELYNYRKTKDPASKWILYSVSIAFVAAVVNVAHLSAGKWFNNIDAAHTIMSVSAYVMYLGMKKIKLNPTH
ncbi:MAG: DUF6962 family protein [Bacteroidia bacterium]